MIFGRFTISLKFKNRITGTLLNSLGVPERLLNWVTRGAVMRGPLSTWPHLSQRGERDRRGKTEEAGTLHRRRLFRPGESQRRRALGRASMPVLEHPCRWSWMTERGTVARWPRQPAAAHEQLRRRLFAAATNGGKRAHRGRWLAVEVQRYPTEMGKAWESWSDGGHGALLGWPWRHLRPRAAAVALVGCCRDECTWGR
jgi:hypothetical protein